MGFPLGYTDLFFPKLLIHTLTFMGFIRNFVTTSIQVLGLGDFIEPDMSWPTRPEYPDEYSCLSAALMREFLPIVKFSDVIDPPERCGDEIRRLANCRHIFHQNCVNCRADHDQQTCPLCRTPFIPNDMQDEFNERLWAASGISDYYSATL